MSISRSKDHAPLCSFTFADGRRCRSPLSASHPHLCYFHAGKEAQALASRRMGAEVSSFLSADYLTACDLSSALGRLFTCVAQGHIKPRTAATLAYLGQIILQSIQLSMNEYINAFGTDAWRTAVRSSFKQNVGSQDPRQRIPASTPGQLK